MAGPQCVVPSFRATVVLAVLAAVATGPRAFAQPRPGGQAPVRHARLAATSSGEPVYYPIAAPADAPVSLTLGDVTLESFTPVTVTPLENSTNLYIVARNTAAVARTLQFTSWDELQTSKPVWMTHLYKFFGLESSHTPASTDVTLAAGETRTLKFYASKDLGGGSAVQADLPFRFKIRETSASGTLTLTVKADDYIMALLRTTSAVVTGHVRDASQRPIPNAVVSVALFNENLVKSVKTDADGLYRLDVLALDDVVTLMGPRTFPYRSVDYFVTADCPGYVLGYHGGLKPGKGQTVTADFVLQPVAQATAYKKVGELATDGTLAYWWIRFAGNGDRVVAVQGQHPPVSIAPSHIIAVDLAGHELWRVVTGGQCWGLDVIADGSLVAAACDDAKAYVIRSADGHVEYSLAIGDRPSANAIDEVRFSPDGQYLLIDAGGGAGGFTVVRARTGEVVWKSVTATASVDVQQAYKSRWSSDSQRLVAGSNGPVTMFTAAGSVVWRNSIGESPLWLEIDDDYNVYAAGKNRDLYAWDRNGNLRWTYRLAHTSNEAWKGLASDGSFMVMPTFNGLLQAIDAQGRILWQRFMPALPTVTPQGATVDFIFGTGHNAQSMTASGNLIAQGSRGYQTLLYDRNGSLLWSHTASMRSDFTGPTPTYQGALSTAISPDGKYIASGYADSVIRIFEQVPPVTASPSALKFGASKAGGAGALKTVSPALTVTVGLGGGTGSWTAVASASWLQITGGSGSGAGQFTVGIVNPGNVIGSQTSLSGTVTITAPDAPNSPVTIPVTLLVDQAGGPLGAAYFPRPFDAGYFPGLQAQAVIATGLGLEIVADPNALTFYSPLDSVIERTVLVRNTGITRARVEFTPDLPSFPNIESTGFIFHPQPAILYLEPGDSHPIRLPCQIDTAAGFWTAGTSFTFHYTLTLRVQRDGSSTVRQLDVQLPQDTMQVVGTRSPSFVDPAPNATIAGRLLDQAGAPVSGGAGYELTVRSGRATTSPPVDAAGLYSAGAFAFRRSGTQVWSEFLVHGRGSGQMFDAALVVTPTIGQSVSVDATLPARGTASLGTVKTIDIDLQAYAWAASADGSLFATAPFHTGLSWATAAPLSFLTAFTGTGELLWRYPINGETPALDVSADGTLLATTRQTTEFTGGTAIVLDRNGALVMEFAPPTVTHWWGTYTDFFRVVKISRDKKYLAAGDAIGGLWLVEIPTGRVVWSAFTNGQNRFLHFDTGDSRLFVSSGDGYLRAFDMAGTLLWKTYVDSWLPDMDVSAHYILASSKTSRSALHLIDKITGATQWAYPVEQRAAAVRIAPDETWLWYCTDTGGGVVPLRNTAFSIAGAPLFDTTDAASSGSISADSRFLVTVGVSGPTLWDRHGHRWWNQAFVTGMPAMSNNHLAWISPDAKRIVFVLGQTESDRKARAYVVTGAGPAGALASSPATLAFGAVKAAGSTTLASQTPAQTVTVTFATGTGTWTASSSQAWLQVTGGSGTGTGQFTAAIVNPGNVIGSSTSLGGTITVTSPDTPASLAIPVTLTVHQTGGPSTSPPIGAFDTPADQATGLQGSFAVTGWALDDVGVDRVEIWRDLISEEPTDHAYTTDPTHPAAGKVFIANPLFVVGSRPDVETAFPAYPYAYRAGWGYLLLSWGLWNQGNGPYTLYAYAFDLEGRSTLLGTKTIGVDNAHATKPFGAIDVPSYGGTVSGSFWNFGWALTPHAEPTCRIANGRVFMAVDSGPLLAVSYGDLRADIAASFPGFSDGTGSGGAYYLDTTGLANGMHSIGWLVYDDCNRSDGIGSRFFTVLNTSADAVDGPTRGAAPGDPKLNAASPSARLAPGDPRRPAESPSPRLDDSVTAWDRQAPAWQANDTASPVSVRHSPDDEWQTLWPDQEGARTVSVSQTGRVEVHLPAAPGAWVGYHSPTGQRRDLPIGSSFDAKTGTFCWQPGPGFLGSFDLLFEADGTGPIRVRIVVVPTPVARK